MSECVIYDFETLSQDTRNGVVLSFAITQYTEKRFFEVPYTFEELVATSHFIKFDVSEQVKKYGRKIDKSTVDWWAQQGDEAKKQLAPSPEDRSISELFDFIDERITNRKNIRKAFTRGNTFDAIFLECLMKDIGKPDPFHWSTIRDTRSMIEGMTFGLDISNSFVPTELQKNFIKHDPRADVAMDIMRMQTLAQAFFAPEK